MKKVSNIIRVLAIVFVFTLIPTPQDFIEVKVPKTFQIKKRK
jgi:hypothetical protein